MQPTGTKKPSTRIRPAYLSPVVGVVILAFGVYFSGSASASVVELGGVDITLGFGWILGSFLTIGLARVQ